MDFLKKAQQTISEQTSKPADSAPPPANPENANSETPAPNVDAAGGSADSEDYGDKALDFLEKKTGYSQSRETNEKITDGARSLFEKATGKKVDSKYSN